MLITDKNKLKEFAACHRVWQGIPSIERTKKGRTFLTFYSGATKETYGNYCVLIKSDNDTGFSEPIAVAYIEGQNRCYDPCIWIDPLGRLWYIWATHPDEEVWAAVCEDPDADELVWSKEFFITNGLILNKPAVLTTGEWLFPVAVWRDSLFTYQHFKTNMKNRDVGSHVYKTCDNGKTFTKTGTADVKDRSFDEHRLIELQNGVLMMLVRTHYGIGVSYSYDRGKKWSKGKDSGFGGPDARFFIGRLKSGRILLINHCNFSGRNNLTALLSEDDGKTYKYSFLLDERNEVSYPDAVEGDDGFIYITYDRERGGFKSSLEEAYADAREILIAKITEEDIIKGELVTEGSFLKRVANKLGKLADGEPDPYKNIDVSKFAEELLSDGGNIIEKVLEHYSLSCMNVHDVNAKKLDKLITRFNESECKDTEQLVKIIEFLRTVPEEKTDTYPVIEKTKEYIEETLREDLSVREIAENIGISLYYLSHLFKTVTGTTIIEYRNELRLTKAKLLLINSDDSINDIAGKVGFSNASYFAEVFARSETVSPSEYRKYHGRRYSRAEGFFNG